MRPVIASTAARVLGSRHPKSITKIKAIRTLYSGVTHLPAKHQKLLNQMGDTYSKQTSLKMLDAACKGHDKENLAVKESVESLWLGKMANATPRTRKRMAFKLGIKGATPFGDNLGIKIVRRYNTGFDNANMYLQLTNTIWKPNQVPSAHCRYSVEYAVYSIQFTVYSLQFTVYSVPTTYSEQCHHIFVLQ